MAQQTAFETLQSKLTIKDTIEFREKHLPEILDAMEKYKNQSTISKMETTQTAMQTLIAWGDEMLLKHPQKILSFAEAIDKAEELLEMEKDQIVAARMNGMTDNELSYLNAEEYYNETYNN